MSTCSYQIIDSFNCERASSLDQIRARQRKNLLSSRFYHKCLKTITNRPSLAKLLCYDPCDSYSESEDNRSELCYESETESINFQHSNANHPIAQHSKLNWEQIGQSDDNLYSDLNRDLAPSPARSSSTSPSGVFPSTGSSTCIPAFFFEEPQSNLKRKQRSKLTDHAAPKVNQIQETNRRQNYKVTKHIDSQNSKSWLPPDSAGVGLQFYALNNYLAQCNDPGVISEIVCSKWQVLLDALGSNDGHLVQDAVLSISYLAKQKLFQDDTVLHMLQNGLVFTLYNSMWTFADAHQCIATLLTNLIISTPSSIPYLTELMSNSQFTRILQERISTSRSSMEINAIVKFYFSVTKTIISQLIQPANSKSQPLIPEILRQTGITQQTLQYYNPISTLRRFLQPELIMELVSLLNHRWGQLVNPETLGMSASVLIDALKLAHFLSSNTTVTENYDWIIETICGFRDSGLEERIIEQQEKAIENFAPETLESRRSVEDQQYDEFLSVSKQFYSSLSKQFQGSIEERPRCCLSNRW